jgi:hypothetical protein
MIMRRLTTTIAAFLLALGINHANADSLQTCLDYLPQAQAKLAEPGPIFQRYRELYMQLEMAQWDTSSLRSDTDGDCVINYQIDVQHELEFFLALTKAAGEHHDEVVGGVAAQAMLMFAGAQHQGIRTLAGQLIYRISQSVGGAYVEIIKQGPR